MRISVALVPALALALTLSACSSTSQGTGSTVTTTGSSRSAGAGGTVTTSSSSSASSTPLDAAKLKALLLTQNDVPSGWTASPSKSSPADQAQAQAKLVACLGVPDPDAHKVAETDSDNYDLDNSEISSSATSYRSQADIDQAATLFTNPKAPSCYKALFKEEITKDLPAGASIDSLDVTVTPGANGGPDNVIAKADASITVTAQGQTVQFVINTWFIKGHQVGAEVDFFGFGKPIDDTIQATALKAVADRVAAA